MRDHGRYRISIHASSRNNDSGGPLNGGFCSFCDSRARNSFAYDPNPNSFDDFQNLSDYPPQPQYQTYSYELCGNDAHFGYDCPPQVLFNRPTFYDDDDDEYTIQYREYLENSSNAITPVLPIEEPDNSLSLGDEHLSTISETESDEVTKSSVEDLVPIPRESEGISNDTCDVTFCDNSPPLDVLNNHFKIFFDFNNDCTSSDDDSFEDIDYVEASPPDSELVSLEEVKEDILHEKLLNLLIACDLPSSDDFSPISIFEEKSVTFSNPLFDSNDDFTSSDNESLSDEDVPEDNVKIYSNPLFEFDDGYISSDVNPLFDEVLENIECKDSYDSNLDESTFLVTPLFDSNKDECFTPSDDIELLLHHDPSISVVSILEGFTDEPPLEENDDLFDLESKENDWKKILYDAPIDDLISEDKVFDTGIHEIIFSPAYDCPDSEGSRARYFVHRLLALQILCMLILGIRYPKSYRLTFIF
ncbi:hypothetical protein Tco_1195827 [Tanacetum coccineum]